MSTAVEQMPVMAEPMSHDMKTEIKMSSMPSVPSVQELKNQHPLHQFDLTQMQKFYAGCVGKLKEHNPTFNPTEWATKKSSSTSNSGDQSNPMVLSSKQSLYEAFATLARETGEPMVLMPNFDYGDILNFERFLQALKQDGVNAIGKYKLYLNYKDMRKFEVDLVVIHPRFGVMLFEVKDCDHLDNKRRSRAKAQLSNARSCFESMGRLIAEAKGWTHAEGHVQCSDFIVLPNVEERPVFVPKTNLNQSLNQTSSSTSSSGSGRATRQLTYLIKSDLSSKVEFANWFQKFVSEPKIENEKMMKEQNKVNKFDLNAMNYMLGLISCVRHNSIMPVVYAEDGLVADMMLVKEEAPKVQEVKTEETKTDDLEKEKMMEKIDKLQMQFQPALNVHAEFFQAEHEAVRSLSKVLVASSDSEKIRKTICLQTLWFLLNDSQKKISVICSEINKAYYEEFFSRQRKLYNNLNNVRFYADLSSCAVGEGQHTLRKDGEIWFFDAGVNGKLSEIVERAKDLNAFWIFTTEAETLTIEQMTELETMKVRNCKLDFDLEKKMKDMSMSDKDSDVMSMPWLNGKSLKLPLRLQCDLLIIGDLISLTQLKSLYRYLKTSYVLNHAGTNNHNGSNHYAQPKQQQLNFNPSKKFRTVKFIRGGTIDNLRSSLKMHDSIQAQVVLMHVGDEDLFKSRSSMTTLERVKELTTLVKEYCPKSFTIMSHLMKRMSRSETSVSEVNKGMVKFCKEVKESKEISNLVYMSNAHMEPEYHTLEGGRALNNKGLRLYVDNFLYNVDYFMIRNHKQH